jgi:hypothetical protein
MRPALAVIALLPLSLALLPLSFACSQLTGDQPAPYDASPLGAGLRLAQVQDPKSPDYHPGDNAAMSSLVVTWLDTFDETMDGKSKGTLYVQDVGSQAPYAGIGIYEQSLVPASLTVLSGDVLDFQGPYQESIGIGTAVFNTCTFLAQLYKPVGTFRYEFTPPDPVELTVDDLSENGAKSLSCRDSGASTVDTNFAMSRRWLGMLVKLKDVYVTAGTATVGGGGFRVSYSLEEADGGVAPNGPAITNEHFDLKCPASLACPLPSPCPVGSKTCTSFAAGTHFSSVTGIVTWFYSFHVAPRYPADLVVAP